jgi:K+ potassium transporter
MLSRQVAPLLRKFCKVSAYFTIASQRGHALTMLRSFKVRNLASAFGIAVALTMLLTSLLMFLAMREVWGWSLPLSSRTGSEKTDHRHRRLLRARRDRPRRRAAKKRDEFASSQGWHGLSPPPCSRFPAPSA